MDDIMDNISELLGSMSEQDMDALRQAAQAMFSGSASDSGSSDAEQSFGDLGGLGSLGSLFSGSGGKGQSDDKGCDDSDDGFSFPQITPEMLRKLSQIMSAMNKKDDRSQLIAALKPHLSPERRKKADSAMQMLKLMDLMPMLQGELGKH